MTTIFGWDMSHYDSPSIGNAVSQGISFITHKAGGDATDAELDDWWAGVRTLDNGILLGAYWVLRPDTSGSPADKADSFLARLDTACPGWRERDAFILQVDCEKWNGDQGTVPSKTYIKTFCDRLVAQTGADYLPIVYGPNWVYGSGLSGLAYPLWASSYVGGSGNFKTLYPGDTSSHWDSYSGQTPAILQYSSSATIGGQTTSDANAFRGTIDQLKALVAPGKAVMPLTTADADLILDRLNARLRDGSDSLSGIMKAITFQYSGGGLPAWDGEPTPASFLNAFTQLFQMVQDIQAEVAALTPVPPAE